MVVPRHPSWGVCLVVSVCGLGACGQSERSKGTTAPGEAGSATAVGTEPVAVSGASGSSQGGSGGAAGAGSVLTEGGDAAQGGGSDGQAGAPPSTDYLIRTFMSPTGSDASGDGTEQAPFATLATALEGLVAGEAVGILPGTY